MKNLIKSILVIAGLAFSSASFAQTGMDHSTTADSTGNRNKSKMQDNRMHSDSTMHKNKMNPNRTDSTQMKDRRRTPSTMPQDSMRNRNQNDRMMQRDSVK